MGQGQRFNCCWGEGLQHKLGISLIHSWKREEIWSPFIIPESSTINNVASWPLMLSPVTGCSHWDLLCPHLLPRGLHLASGVRGVFYVSEGNGRPLLTFACVA